VQMSCMALSANGSCDPDVLAINAGSFALLCSNIPTCDPVAAVRVALTTSNDIVLNPPVVLLSQSAGSVLYAGTRDGAVLVNYTPGYVDGVSTQLTVDQLGRMLHEAQAAVVELAEAQITAARACAVNEVELDGDGLEVALQERARSIVTALITDGAAQVEISSPPPAAEVMRCAEEMLKIHFSHMELGRISRAVRIAMADTRRVALCRLDRRDDGRTAGDARPLVVENGPLPHILGSATAARGNTVALGMTVRGGRSARPTVDSWVSTVYGQRSGAYTSSLTTMPSVRKLAREDGCHGSMVLDDAFVESALSTMVSQMYPAAMRTTCLVRLFFCRTPFLVNTCFAVSRVFHTT
jgi:polyribonucleotide nucleotidyltransferase